MDENQLASLLFPSTPSGPASSATSLPLVDQAMADKLYGNTNKATAPTPTSQRDDRPMTELTDEEQADRLYGDTDPVVAHSTAVIAITNAAMQDHLHDRETAQEIAADWAKTFATHKLNATESADLAEVGASVLANPPSQETVSNWVETSLANLQVEYGIEGAGRALQDARSYIQSQPGSARMLDSLGLASHPKVVAIAAARGRAMRLAGKLR